MWRLNPSGKISQERPTRSTVISTYVRAARPSGRARRGSGAGCSATKCQSFYGVYSRILLTSTINPRMSRVGMRYMSVYGHLETPLHKERNQPIWWCLVADPAVHDLHSAAPSAQLHTIHLDKVYSPPPHQLQPRKIPPDRATNIFLVRARRFSSSFLMFLETPSPVSELFLSRSTNSISFSFFLVSFRNAHLVSKSLLLMSEEPLYASISIGTLLEKLTRGA